MDINIKTPLVHKNFALFSNEIELSAKDFNSLRSLVIKEFDLTPTSIVALISNSPISDSCAILFLLGYVKELILLPTNIEPVAHDDSGSSKKNKCTYLTSSIILEKILTLKKSDTVTKGKPVFNSKSSLSIFTSGTTGTPKKIKHQIYNLTSIFSDRQTKYTWGLTYLPFKMAGIQVILSAAFSGDNIVIPTNQTPSSMSNIFIKYNVDAISATPSMWRTILSSKKSGDIELIQCTLGGEIADQTTLSKIETIYPDAKITHIYASTEIGVGFSVTDVLSGFPVKFLNSSHKKFPKMKIKDDTLHFYKDNVWQDSGDMVKLVKDRVFFFGRSSGSINVGGNKVMPESVEDVIRTLDFVKEVNVYAESNNLLGNIVKADVELFENNTEKESVLKKRIRELCVKKLPKYSIPVKLVFDKIELTASGKIKR